MAGVGDEVVLLIRRRILDTWLKFMFAKLLGSEPNVCGVGARLGALVGENVGCNVGAAVGFIVGAAVGVTQEALTPVAKLNSVRALPVNAAQRWCATSFTGRYVLSRRARKNGGFMSRGPIAQAPCWLRKKRNSGAAVP